MRQKIVAGNWKMNNTLDETKKLIKELKKELKSVKLKKDTRVIIAPTFVNLLTATKKTKKTKIEVAAQNMHQAKNGAYTGEISAEMLTSVGVKTVILGHSERRTYFNETDKLLTEKVNTALENNLEVIFCFGEQLEDRNSENHFKVVESQLKNALFHLKSEDIKNIILAYEPVWAIGTGQTASADQAQEMHAFIRGLFASEYSQELADTISILYGGSVKPNNAEEIFSKPDVDGGLIGGASLKAKDFSAIVKAI
ncbi:triose-phosphate isomerase [Tenacibaculum sp. IB213877]|uniref:triose-phosphate isomerase n=1 Tax=Tenacibaculum sp. IB213877 TaxID=3097351 RepID=UPI002A59BAB2|nr:triose-phosphate isomerase [Tenacibaculum sp. IB213877]MDY0780148.1 triose-phosphate isomerase [Tenacibaculum sp. IB213877]